MSTVNAKKEGFFMEDNEFEFDKADIEGKNVENDASTITSSNNNSVTDISKIGL